MMQPIDSAKVVAVQLASRRRVDALSWVITIFGAMVFWTAGFDCSAQSDDVDASAVAPLVATEAELASHQRMQARLIELSKQFKDVPRYGEKALNDAIAEFERAKKAGDVVAVLKSIHDMGSELTSSGKSEKALEVLGLSDRVLAQVAANAPPGFVRDFEAKFYLAKGIAALRKAEDENCVMCQDGEGCLFPISGKGIHQRPEGSTMAVKYFQETLRRDPQNLTAAWLLNIAQMTLGDYPQAVPEMYRIPEARLRSQASFPKFRNVSWQLSLATLSLAGGVIADDFDGDHDLDIVVSDWSPKGQIRFFRNQGDGTFQDQTEAANLTGIYGGLNLNQADYDNDGDLDVFVLRGAWLREYGKYPNSLLRNDGNGRFVDVSYDAGIAGEGLDFPTQTASWADYDNDGDVDLLVGNEAFPCQLFENDGDGHFTEVAKERGISQVGYTKGVAWGDVDADGFPEIYLSNHTIPNVMMRNEAGRRFVDMTQEAGVAEPRASFGVWFWDYNNDGMLDLYCPGYFENVKYLAADYFSVPSENFGISSDIGGDVLYEGDGKGKFSNVSKAKGLVQKTQTMGCNYGDLNNDGFLDIYLGTGYPAIEGMMPNVMYLNERGERFSDVSIAGGFSHLQKGHAIAFADFDHDGDQDVFAELGGAFPGDAYNNALFENPGFDNHWIKLKLIGKQSNRSGVGAKIHLTFREHDTVRHVYRWVGSGGSFGSNPLRQEIGVGKAKVIDEIEITWPTSGSHQRFESIDVDQCLSITEFADEPVRIPITPMPFQVD